MKIVLIFMVLLTSCSIPSPQENSNVVIQSQSNTDIKEDANSLRAPGYPEYYPVWRITHNDQYGLLASVSAIGKAAGGELQTSISLQCPSKSNPLNSIDYIVFQTEKAVGFNFDDFEGPDAVSGNKRLLEIRAVAPHQKMSFRAVVWGNLGLFGVSDQEEKVGRLVRMIAGGSTEVTLIMHDNRDYRNTIETTFPAIDPASETAKILNGCRPRAPAKSRRNPIAP